MSFQAVLTNHTPFPAEKFVLMDRDGQEAVLVVLAATFEAPPAGELTVAEEQGELLVEDVYSDDPASSSLLIENELALEKPRVDVVVRGTAYAPRGRPAEQVPIELRLGDIRKALWVTGHRVWSFRSLSRPHPFAEMPVTYERAFGGMNLAKNVFFGPNPVGVGFKGAVSRDPVQAAVPNVEYPDSMMTSPSDKLRPAGLGPIARWWEPRTRLAGTYDEKYLASRWPLLPPDFDAAFNQIAPADQQSTTLAGGEMARLVNLTRDGKWEFRLPRLEIPVHLVYDTRFEETRLRLDTVFIEPDQRRVRLTSRLCRTTVRGPETLREIAVGRVSRGWLRSRRERKPYLDLAGTRGGLRTSTPYFT
jgi:hypothetical protein